jgi:hypothetical protein
MRQRFAIVNLDLVTLERLERARCSNIRTMRVASDKSQCVVSFFLEHAPPNALTQSEVIELLAADPKWSTQANLNRQDLIKIILRKNDGTLRPLSELQDRIALAKAIDANAVEE